MRQDDCKGIIMDRIIDTYSATEDYIPKEQDRWKKFAASMFDRVRMDIENPATTQQDIEDIYYWLESGEYLIYASAAHILPEVVYKTFQDMLKNKGQKKKRIGINEKSIELRRVIMDGEEYNYFAGSDGNIYYKHKKSYLQMAAYGPRTKTANSYLKVQLRKDGMRKNFQLKRLIYRAFVGEPGKYDVITIDGDYTNTKPENLKLSTKLLAKNIRP